MPTSDAKAIFDMVDVLYHQGKDAEYIAGAITAYMAPDDPALAPVPGEGQDAREFPGWMCPMCGAWDSGSVMPRRAQWCDGACSHPKTQMLAVTFNLAPVPASEREPDVCIVIERVERTGGPMYKTHHWHANVHVGQVNVCDVWCYTRSIALDEADYALRAAGVNFGEEASDAR